jgi:hypothetical protein
MKRILLISSLLLALIPLGSAQAAFNPLKSACSQVQHGLNGSANSSACTPSGSGDPVVNVIHVATTIVASLAGIAAVVIIIVSGISMITSAGKPDAVAAARKRLTGALIGLVIVALAYTLINFATDKLIG